MRATYKELIKKYHPDCGGDLETMQEINAEYDALFAKLPKDAPQGDTAESQTTASGDGDNVRKRHETRKALYYNRPGA